MISVLYDPLFSVVFKDGQTGRLGLIDLLSQAHLITELKAYSCTGKLALLRVCMAFLMDAYKPKTPYDRANLLERKHFDRVFLLDYVKKCEVDGPCFLLDDERHPFMQNECDMSMNANSEKSIAAIMFDRTSGNSHVHLDHRMENEHEANTAQAFEAMLETYMFCVGNHYYSSNVNGMPPPIYAIIHGDNLFETLVLNMVSLKEMGNIPLGEGEVAWKNSTKQYNEAQTIEMSVLKALTWQPRSIRLVWEKDGMIRKLHMQNGYIFKGNGLWRDPHVPYIHTQMNSWSSLKPKYGKAFWRESGVLVSNSNSIKSTIPIINLQMVKEGETYIDIEMIGLIIDQGLVIDRVSERLKMPTILLRDQELALEFYNALEICDRMYAAIKWAVRKEFCCSKDEEDFIEQQAGEAFLYEMHNILFDDYLYWLQQKRAYLVRIKDYLDAMWEVLDEMILKKIVEKTGNDIASIERQNAVRGKVRKAYNIIREGVEG